MQSWGLISILLGGLPVRDKHQSKKCLSKHQDYIVKSCLVTAVGMEFQTSFL